MIAIQVTAGIVLAYIIIINQKKLLRFGRWILSALAVLVIIGFIVWAGQIAIQFAGSTVSSTIWAALWARMPVIPAFMLGCMAILGMLMLGGLLAGRKPEAIPLGLLRALDAKKLTKAGWVARAGLVGLITATTLINYAISIPVWAYTPIGRWYEAINVYGQSNGWKDGLGILFAALLWQWVWVPLGIYFIITRLRVGKVRAA